jgi:hypothetical protein
MVKQASFELVHCALFVSAHEVNVDDMNGLAQI